MDEKEFQHLKEIKIKFREKIKSYPNVNGIGIGLKITNSKYTEKFVIRVYVTKKFPLEKLKEEERIPSKLDDVQTDVIQIGTVQPFAHTFRARPARGGDSIGDCYWVNRIDPCTNQTIMTVGTLGGLFIDNTDDSNVILSCNHVLANSDDTSTTVAYAGDNIVQPGVGDCLSDNNCDDPTNVIGTLKRWVEYELVPNWNKVDAAIAEVVPGDVLDDIHDIGIPTGYRRLTHADQSVTYVQKSGRTTEYSQGLIEDVSWDMLYPMVSQQGHQIQFEDQIVIRPINKAVILFGDSGSLLLDMSNKIVGLLWAGTCYGWAVANHIDDVLNELNIRLPLPRIRPCWDQTIIPCLRLSICRPQTICFSETVCPNITPEPPGYEERWIEICRKETYCPNITPVPIDIKRYAVIDLEKIPAEYRRSVEKMLSEIEKFRNEELSKFEK
ncbi:MAG: hypothetical protein ACFFC6_11830 [Promethearchaeota archaeon]